MKKNPWLVAGLSLIVLFALFAASAKWILPGYLKKKITEGVAHGCPDCVLYIKAVDVELTHPGRLILHDIKFAQGQGGHALVEARLQDLTLDLALSKTSGDTFVFDNVEAEGLEFIYADGDALRKPTPESKGGETKIAVAHASFENALFRYAHTKKGQTSILHFKNISGEIKDAGNTPEFAVKVATAHLQGQIEKSGHADLQIAALLRCGPWHVDIDLHLEDQNLEDVNTFFTPNDGVILKGHMMKARAKLETRDEITKSHVEAQYKDAEFKQSPTAEKGAIEATLTTLGASLMMNKDNSAFPAGAREADVEVKRDHEEPLVHYLLRSAKLGLLDVVKKKKP